MQLFYGFTPIEPVGDDILLTSDEGEAHNEWVPMELSATISKEGFTPKLKKLLFPKKSRWPRKLKKAIGQMWKSERNGDECCMTFKVLHKTKWQRKAARLVKTDENGITFPLSSGRQIIIPNVLDNNENPRKNCY